MYNEKQTAGGVLLNKNLFTGSFTSAWKENEELLGFTSSNGSEIYFDLELENYAEDGKYSVAFGLVFDSKADAVKPNAVRVQLHTGDGFTDEGSVSLDSFDQADGSYKRYGARPLRVKSPFAGCVCISTCRPTATSSLTN